MVTDEELLERLKEQMLDYVEMKRRTLKSNKEAFETEQYSLKAMELLEDESKELFSKLMYGMNKVDLELAQLEMELRKV